MYIRIKNYRSRVDADMDKHLLASHGISATVESDDAGGMRPDLMMATGGVRLFVNKEDADTARQLLSDV